MNLHESEGKAPPGTPRKLANVSHGSPSSSSVWSMFPGIQHQQFFVFFPGPSRPAEGQRGQNPGRTRPQAGGFSVAADHHFYLSSSERCRCNDPHFQPPFPVGYQYMLRAAQCCPMGVGQRPLPTGYNLWGTNESLLQPKI